MALSTLSPTTSPCLSAIQLGLVKSHLVNRFIETMIEETSDDLRQVAVEVARIEREFGGTVNLTLV